MAKHRNDTSDDVRVGKAIQRLADHVDTAIVQYMYDAGVGEAEATEAVIQMAVEGMGSTEVHVDPTAPVRRIGAILPGDNFGSLPRAS